MLGLALAACAGPAPREVAQTGPATAPGDREATLVAGLAPAAGADQAAEAPLADVAGDRLVFRSHLSHAEREMIRDVLPDAVALSGGIDAAPMRIAYADLNGDGTDEAFVFIKSGPYCGSRDVCNFWIFQQSPTGWIQINSNDDAARALEVLPTRANGYRDVRILGECGREDCNFILAWTGTRYEWVDAPSRDLGA